MNPIRRRIVLKTILAVLLSPISSAFAVQGPTSKAIKLGQTTVMGGKKFTVIRMKVKGKYQLVWDKGVLIPVKPTPTATPSATPTPTATATQTATPTSSATATPSATPTPSATATPSATPAPTPTPTPKNLGTVLGQSSSVAVGETKFYSVKNRAGVTRTYIVSRSNNEVRAMSAYCTHNGCVVQLKSEGLVCPCHNARFNAASGEVERGPASTNLGLYQVTEENGQIFIND